MRILKYIRLLFCKPTEKEFFLQLCYLLGYMPKNIKYYRKAFTHKSSVTSSDKHKQYNERLEFLGDCIIDAIIADYLFQKYPNESEGFLTKMKSKIVNRKSLNQIAVQLHLDSYLQSNIANVKENDALGNAFEALIGAMCLDKGFDFTKQYFISKIIERFFDISFLEANDTNYKSQLLEIVQKKKQTIVFDSEGVEPGPENSSQFVSIIKIDNVAVATAKASTKKEAEQRASKIVIESMNIH